jgi:hypothetical protein
MADKNEDDDDNASAEGAVFQDLFGDDSSNSDNDDDDDDDEPQHHSTEQPLTTQPTNVFVQRSIMHVVIEEQQVGGSIAHRLWPPAEHLAKFVTDCAKGELDLNHLVMSNNDPRKDNNQQQLRQEVLQTLQQKCLQQKCPILELGAGIGLTGLEIATQLDTQVLLTELEEGLLLLNRNVELNKHRFFRRGIDAVQVQKFYWGDDEQCQQALEWYHQSIENSGHPKKYGGSSTIPPLLILGSDCVYFEELHKPLELALHGLLSQLPPHSLCLLAGVRRWKRDNAFYQSILGKHTRTKTHQLRCTLLQETIQRNTNDNEQQESSPSRVVLRIYAVQWVPIISSSR